MTLLLAACADRIIRIYDTRQGNFKQFNSIQALDVGWSVLDTAFRLSSFESSYSLQLYAAYNGAMY